MRAFISQFTRLFEEGQGLTITPIGFNKMAIH